MDNQGIASKRDTWKVMCKLRDIILKFDGLIFGGFVRDSIIHDHYAQEFYTTVMDDDFDNMAITQYNNPDFLPETFNRTCIPNDIDCFIPEHKYDSFYNELWSKRYKVITKFVRDPLEYFNNINTNDSTLLHKRLHITPDLVPILKEIRKLPIPADDIYTAVNKVISNAPRIIVDVITSTKNITEPFFSPIDFECNALYVSKYGISCASSLCRDKSSLSMHHKTNKIISNIVKKQTSVYDATTFRIEKLLKNDWTVTYNGITSVKDELYEGYCIICHDELPELHVKATCCDCRYHPKCLKETIANDSFREGSCIMCKADCFLSYQHTHFLDAFPQRTGIIPEVHSV
jgi:hypothetical protein